VTNQHVSIVGALNSGRESKLSWFLDKAKHAFTFNLAE